MAEPQTRDMRRSILDATVHLIGQIGWSQVTTRRVAERAGINNALIHYYFGSKEALLREAVIGLFTEEFEGPMSALMEAEDVHAGVDALFTAIEALDVTDTHLIAVSEAMLQGLRDDAIRTWVQHVLDEATEAIASMILADQAAGRVRRDLDAHGAALVLVGTLDALVLYRFNHPTLDLEPSRRAIHTMITQEEEPR